MEWSPFPEGKYSVIYVDPPWDYKGQVQHTGKGGRTSGGASVHYPTIRLNDLMQLPIKEIAEDDCLLFLWVTNPHLDQGISLLKAWGFKYATVAFVWDKQCTNPGYYTLSGCELCLVGKRGKIPRPRGSRKVRQLIQAKRTNHSAKPTEARERITQMFPDQRKIELFARGPQPDGWTVWGDESK